MPVANRVESPTLDPTSGAVLSEELKAQLYSATRYTVVAGIAFSILFLIALWFLTGVPGGTATDEELRSFYTSDRRSTVTFVALYIFPFAGIAFLWFLVSLRSWMSYRSSTPLDDVLASVQLVSGIVYLAMFFAAAASLSVNAVAIDVGGVDPDSGIDRQFPLFGNALFFVFAIRMGAMFVMVSTTIGRRYRILPTWFVIVGYAVGLTMLLTASFSRSLILVFPVWTLMMCILILWHARTVLGGTK